jgi:hypothetical protein
MLVNLQALQELRSVCALHRASLVAVSKTKPAEAIAEAYAAGQRDFGENYVQEMCEKAEQLPRDIRWHFIGHLQTNKVRQIVGFVHLIHGVDSLRLLKEINKEAGKACRVVNCLLQVFIANEVTKFGLSESELTELLEAVETGDFAHVKILGLMGIATNTRDVAVIRNEFRTLRVLYEKCKQSHPHAAAGFSEVSMGMTSDYSIALEEGSTMIRVGSAIFGSRSYATS